ncbi:uncharacterized protein IL334_002917 [Kwoniella shivajii]|uniref:Exonuclease domain-containing protein n=1 Tax=Kwoniella shivajii TaxID=564305 RepID=A0ABZ1CW20_9TREE|nr:hypothetical protein IL334_002917 [Kwoniella shivajii]
MFSHLGLLSSSHCPDATCKRPRCFFSHAEASSSRITLPPKVEIPSSVRQPVRQKSDVEEEERIRGVVRRVTLNELKKVRTVGSPLKGVSKSVEASTTPNPVHTGITSTATPGRSAMTATRPNPTTTSSSVVNTSRPPILPIALKPSPHPRADRQKGLNTLYAQYAKLYSAVLHISPDIAHNSAFAQEAEVAASSSNVRIYKTAIHQAAVSVSRRPPPDKLDHPSIGTVKESRANFEVQEKAQASRLHRARIERYCLPLADFDIWRYPNPNDENLFNPELTGTEPNAEGTENMCSRCKVPFIVSSKDLEKRHGECRFHYGRPVPERIEGRRKWIYTCCGRERGEAGCEDGIHVFTDGDDDVKLAKRVAYKTVNQVVGDEGGLGKWNEVVAMDCEMIFTTAGVSLGRVTIVDENGEILLDELVRQTVPVLDVNTRFSGITTEQLETAVMDLPSVRAAACMFIGAETILVGHGLENDLRALRLLHTKVIDTAVVFPHDKGPPFRRALRDIVKEKLGYFIQDRTSDLGHSSAVDAKSTLEALKWKVRDDNDA